MPNVYQPSSCLLFACLPGNNDVWLMWFTINKTTQPEYEQFESMIWDTTQSSIKRVDKHGLSCNPDSTRW